jgi:type II secretory pathway component PulM
MVPQSLALHLQFPLRAWRSACRVLRSALHHLYTAIHGRLSFSTHFRLQTLSALLARLSPREQRFVYAAGVTLGFVLLYLLVIDPLWQMQVDMRARVAAKEGELQEMVALRQEYLTAKAEVERAQSTAGSTFSPVAFLEDLTNNTIGQEKVLAITPLTQENQANVTIETIELKLSGVSLRELVDLLYKIDTTGVMLRPSQLSIKKRYKDPYTFDVLLTTLAIRAR